MLFFLLGDLRFYEYHKREYTGDLGSMIKFMRFVEDKQWDIIKYGELGDSIEKIVENMPSYTQFSNSKFQKVERRDEFFFRTTYEYVFYSFPMLIVIFFILNKIFYALFNHRISKYLRMFSFWGYFSELAIQGNIEIFTFLALRQFILAFSFDIESKAYISLLIILFWIVVVFSIAGYYMYYYFYGPLSKYFLINNYRLKSAFTSNMIIYGMRPLVKGAVHSLCYHDYLLQISLLLTIELLTVIILCYFEMAYGTHRKKFVLFF